MTEPQDGALTFCPLCRTRTTFRILHGHVFLEQHWLDVDGAPDHHVRCPFASVWIERKAEGESP